MSYVNRFSCFDCLETFDTHEQATEHVTKMQNPLVPTPNPHKVYPIHTYVEDDEAIVGDADPTLRS